VAASPIHSYVTCPRSPSGASRSSSATTIPISGCPCAPVQRSCRVPRNGPVTRLKSVPHPVRVTVCNADMSPESMGLASLFLWTYMTLAIFVQMFSFPTFSVVFYREHDPKWQNFQGKEWWLIHGFAGPYSLYHVFTVAQMVSGMVAWIRGWLGVQLNYSGDVNRFPWMPAWWTISWSCVPLGAIPMLLITQLRDNPCMWISKYEKHVNTQKCKHVKIQTSKYLNM
jgi:hypothetical protein